MSKHTKQLHSCPLPKSTTSQGSSRKLKISFFCAFLSLVFAVPSQSQSQCTTLNVPIYISLNTASSTVKLYKDISATMPWSNPEIACNNTVTYTFSQANVGDSFSSTGFVITTTAADTITVGASSLTVNNCPVSPANCPAGSAFGVKVSVTAAGQTYTSTDPQITLEGPPMPWEHKKPNADRELSFLPGRPGNWVRDTWWWKVFRPRALLLIDLRMRARA